MLIKNYTPEEIEQKVDQITDWLNNMSFSYKSNAKMIVDFLSRRHRTLQANFIRLLVQILKEYAKIEYYDGRNEHAVKTCKEIAELDNYIPHI